MKKITSFLALLIVGIGFSQTNVFINEIHYDNDGADTDEGVEVAGPAGTDLTGWSIESYNGNTSSSYGTEPLSGTIPNENSTGYGALWFPISGLQNGAPDGVALVDNNGDLVQFLSYEGFFVGVGGPADGVTSEDIGVFESGSPLGESLQLTGFGTVYEDFSWSESSAASAGSINTNQTFSNAPHISVVDAEPSGSITTVPPNELDQIELEFNISNFTIGEPGTATEADGYVSWEITNDTDGGVHQSGVLYDLSNQPIQVTPFIAGKTFTLTASLKDNSDVDQTTYTLTADLSYTQVTDIAVLKTDVGNNGLNFYYEITGPVTFTHGDISNNRKWFQDANPSGIYIEDMEEIIPNGAYSVGNQVSGLRGFTREVNGVLTFEPVENSGSINGSTTVSPVVISITEFNSNFEAYESVLVGFENVTFTNGDGTATFDSESNYEFSAGTEASEVRTIFTSADYINTVIPSGEISGLVGIAAELNDATQIYPRSQADINVTLGASSFETNSFKLYPNPVSTGILNIETVSSKNINVQFFNMLGQKVLTSKTSKNINVSNLDEGIYLLKINQGSTFITKKLIVK